MKLLGVNCSPRKVNSYGVIKLMMEGITQPEIEKEIISLGDYKLNLCLGELKCLFKQPFECIQKNDDLAAIQQKFYEADGYIFAIPVYIMTVPGGLKNFIDRCTTWAHTFPFIGRYAAIVITIAAPAGRALRTLEYMKAWLRLLGICVSGELLIYTWGGYKELGEKNIPIEDVPGVREKSEELSKILVSDMLNKPKFIPDAEDLAQWKVLKYKATLVGGFEGKRWKDMGWIEKDHWSL